MVKIDLKGQVKEFDQGVTAAEVAKSIGMGLYKSACAAKIDGEVCDLRTPIEKDCSLEILTFDTAEGKHAYWHTTSHIMAQAVMRLYPGTKFSIGPAIENGFYYDFDMEQPLSTEDLPKIEAEMKKIIKEDLPLERFALPADKAKELGLKPIARIIAGAAAGVDPRIMGMGPVAATRKLMKALEPKGLKLEDFGLVEINEAFAAQSVACVRELGLNPEIVNVNGGAIALGHPLGCSGARISTTLVHEMQKRDVQFGLASICIAGGLGMAMAFEKL
jgi:hypothetical protein